MNKLDHPIVRLASHIRQWAIIYVIVSYGIFVALNLYVFNMDDPYGIAMMIIAMFWFIVMKIFDIASSFIITR